MLRPSVEVRPPAQLASVLLVGAAGAGKSSLADRLLFPDYVYTYEAAGGSDRRSVCVMLEDKETELVVQEGAGDQQPADCILVLFSVTEPASLAVAQNLLSSLGSTAAPILVGNKVDLVRARAVSPTGQLKLLRFSSIACLLFFQMAEQSRSPPAASTWR